MHPEMLHILEEFYSFPSPAARAAFADKWIGNVGKRFEQTWQVFYELLKIVEDQHLYTRAEALEGKQAFPTFQAYWEKKTGKSFDQWFELEQTYKYVYAFKPELLKGLYETAKEASRRQADLDGFTYTQIIKEAFRQYFEGP
jgi:hypothetical protein